MSWSRGPSVALVALCALLLGAGCQQNEARGGSSGSNWLRCETFADCSAASAAVACSAEGYCIDADDLPIVPIAHGVQDLDVDAGAPAARAQDASTAPIDSATVEPVVSADAALSRVDSEAPGGDSEAPGLEAGALQPYSECACAYSNVKMPDRLDGTPGDPTRIVVKFADGARVRLSSGQLVFDAQGWTAQDLAELACAKLDPAAAARGLADMRALLAARPSISIEALFDTPVAELDAQRDFDGRHCPMPGDQAGGDLANFYHLNIIEADGEPVMRALDANPLVTIAYFAPLPVSPP